eukprot:s2180_g3.t1
MKLRALLAAAFSEQLLVGRRFIDQLRGPPKRPRGAGAMASVLAGPRKAEEDEEEAQSYDHPTDETEPDDIFDLNAELATIEEDEDDLEDDDDEESQDESGPIQSGGTWKMTMTWPQAGGAQIAEETLNLQLCSNMSQSLDMDVAWVQCEPFRCCCGAFRDDQGLRAILSTQLDKGQTWAPGNLRGWRWFVWLLKQCVCPGP